MNLFVDYLQPLTNWLQANPNWSLFITFFIALTESLAIIGSIIPGSVTMTAIGILAGSGIMRIDLTLMAATLGAVCGDSLSYALGYFYSEKLVDIWPFKKYPSWLIYGKDFFSRHGGKSVLIGRFVGPLRSIIPVIAGILHMKQWRFLTANVISAIGWSLLYVMPGVLIGAAGHELSTESATRLFILILLLLVSLWLISLLIKWILIALHSLLRNHLHNLWLKLKGNRFLIKIYNALTPIKEKNHYSTAGLVLLTLISLLGFIILSLRIQCISSLNLPLHLFVQSFHTSLLEVVFIICTQLTSILTMSSLYLLCSLWFIYHRNLRTLVYLSSLLFFSTIIALILPYYIASPRPQGLLVIMPGNSFPASNLLMATAFYGFILFYINNKYALLTNTLRTVILVVLGLSGLGAIYLGDYWLTDVFGSYFIGATICLAHCLMYRKSNCFHAKKNHSALMFFSLFAGIIFSTALSVYFNFKTLANNHIPYHKEYTLNQTQWWNQQKPILPLYRLNRIGKKISLLNIQYVGDLNKLKTSLSLNGWEVHTETFMTKVLMRMNSESSEIKLPILTQLYENKRPELVMTYQNKGSQLILVLTIWESNYYLSDINRPIWIGTVHQDTPEYAKNEAHGNPSKSLNSLSYIIPALNQFTLRRIKLSSTMISNSSFPTMPYVLLIKNSELAN
jgi:membrane protein DedA with SNARE-associated domain